MRPTGRPFPDLPKLRGALEMRSWSTADLATAADIHPVTAWKVLSGARVAPETIEAVAKALEDHPATKTATGRFLLAEPVLPEAVG